MGRKKATSNQQIVTTDTNDNDEEFQLNLDVLDGEDAPVDSDSDEQVVTQPRKRRKRKMKQQVLGVDYQALEEKRLEDILFGGVVEQFMEEPELATETESPSVVVADEIPNETDLVPADVLGNNSISAQKPAWVDEDDETTK